MDQVQQALKILKEHYFWFLCGVVVLASGISWFLTTSWLQQETDQRISTLDGQFSQVSTIQNTQLHPNDETLKGMQALNDDYTVRVANAWTYQFDQQKEILVWPRNIFSRRGLESVQTLKPIETTVPFVTPHDESLEKLNANDREKYRNFIAQELPRLAEKINAHWAASGRPPAGKEFLVEWDASNQQQLVSSRFEWPTVPITLQILYAQEDIWVLSELMEIIAKTNEGATARYQAPVKKIEFIDIGPDAIGLAGKVDGAASTGPMGGAGGMMMSGQGGMGFGGGSAALDGEFGGGDSGDTQQAVATDPADRRYVDKDFEPVTAEQLRSAFQSPSPDNAFLLVAKRMPVRMRLKVDFREINHLLATCGNNRLPVEVRQVRINRPSGSTFSGRGALMSGGGGGGGGGAGMTLGSPPSGMFGGGGEDGEDDGGAGLMGGMAGTGGGGFPMSGMGGMMSGGAGGGNVAAGSSVWDVDVEIYGMVYIYNPVNVELLGKALESTADAPAAAPADSAAANPPPPAPAG